MAAQHRMAPVRTYGTLPPFEPHMQAVDIRGVTCAQRDGPDQAESTAEFCLLRAPAECDTW